MVGLGSGLASGEGESAIIPLWQRIRGFGVRLFWMTLRGLRGFRCLLFRGC